MSDPSSDGETLRPGARMTPGSSEDADRNLARELFGESMTQKMLCEPVHFPDGEGDYRLSLWSSPLKPPAVWVGDTEVHLVVHLPGPGAIEAITLAGELACATVIGPEGPKLPLLSELRLFRGEELLVRAPAGWWFETPIRIPEATPIDIVAVFREPVRATHVQPHLFPFEATLIVRTPVAYPKFG